MEYLLTHTTATDRHIPVLSLTAANAKAGPKVILMHGLGGTKESMLFDLYAVAQTGMTGVAIDMRLHGERPDASRLDATLEADFMSGMQQVVYGSAEDVGALLDDWQAEPGSVGFLGISTGGMVGHVLAANERRIGAMACCISSPDWLTASPEHAISAESVAGQMLAAISPVNHADSYPPLPLYMANGLVDDIVTAHGSILLEERLRPLYEADGMGERIKLVLYPELGHVYLPEMRDQSIAWIQRFLL